MMNKYLLSSAIAALLVGCGSAPKQQAQVPEYPCAKVDTASAIIFTDFAAEIKSEVVVDIRPRVSGYITKIAALEGSTVRQGQVLFVIDQADLEEQYNAAVANVDVAKAKVANADLEVRKLAPLVDKGIISPFELENAKSNLVAAQASLKYSESQMNNAKIGLSYATITSPVDGVVGRIVVRQGTLVSPSSQDPLTTVSGDGTVSAYFSIDEQSMLNIAESVQGLSLSEKVSKLPHVNLLMSNGSQYAYNGKLELASGLVDMTTGSVQMKANFPNKDNNLRSGSSGVVRLNNPVHGVLMVPQKATFELQDRRMVYVVTDSSTVKATTIEVNGRSGDNYVVADGLSQGDVVLLEGVDHVREGDKIQAKIQ